MENNPTLDRAEAKETVRKWMDDSELTFVPVTNLLEAIRTLERHGELPEELKHD